MDPNLELDQLVEPRLSDADRCVRPGVPLVGSPERDPTRERNPPGLWMGHGDRMERERDGRFVVGSDHTTDVGVVHAIGTLLKVVRPTNGATDALAVGPALALPKSSTRRTLPIGVAANNGE
ncbi:MAG: hypothetical protein ACRDGD_01575 [Candidatus Limnocylindria bacterium]